MPRSDDIAARVAQLHRHEIMATAPLLARIEQLLDDARRQYDETAAAVLLKVSSQLVEDIEAAVNADRWVDVATAARIARRPEGTVRYWCRRRLVEARKVGARAWAIDRQSLLRRAAA